MKSYFLLLLIILIPGCKNKTDEKSTTGFLVDQPEVSAKTIDLLLDCSRLEKKNLFLVFSFQGCGICRIFENYHNDPVVNGILSHYLIVRKIDYYKTPGGKELYAKYGQAGFPSWTIIDSANHVIMDSGGLDDRRGNVGFPDSEKDREFYLMALKKAAPTITTNEIQILHDKLREYRPDRVPDLSSY